MLRSSPSTISAAGDLGTSAGTVAWAFGAAHRRTTAHISPAISVVCFVCFLVGVSCSTVDPGGNFQISPTTYDENYFYCQVEPQVILAKSCSTGVASMGDSPGSCHGTTTSFHLADHPQIPCNGLVPSALPTSEASQNYAAAVLEMSPNVDSASLLVRPSGTNHKRVFDLQSPEAQVIRAWAIKYASR